MIQIMKIKGMTRLPQVTPTNCWMSTSASMSVPVTYDSTVVTLCPVGVIRVSFLLTISSLNQTFRPQE